MASKSELQQASSANQEPKTLIGSAPKGNVARHGGYRFSHREREKPPVYEERLTHLVIQDEHGKPVVLPQDG
jgi:hypothetical protein